MAVNSDGWDRTAQTCSLAQFLLDPHYRTIRGFMTLVEKEWLGFGHKFLHRNGFLDIEPRVSGCAGRGAGERLMPSMRSVSYTCDLSRWEQEVSPIFLQFLEASWQILQQFPRAFEFNELFLVTMHDCLHSCQFGTFLGNCERERKKLGLSQETQSVWSYILSR
jgi:myotubularin-related protein 6/7/8